MLIKGLGGRCPRAHARADRVYTCSRDAFLLGLCPKRKMCGTSGEHFYEISSGSFWLTVDIGEAGRHIIVMEESFQTLHLVRHWRQEHFQYPIHYHFLVFTHPCNDPQSLTLSQVLQLPLSPMRLWEMKPSLSAQISRSKFTW